MNFTIGAWAFREKTLGADKKLMYEVGMSVCVSSQEGETLRQDFCPHNQHSSAHKQKIYFWAICGNWTTSFPTFLNNVEKMVVKASHPAYRFSIRNLTRTKILKGTHKIIACALSFYIQQRWLTRWKILCVAGNGLAQNAWETSREWGSWTVWEEWCGFLKANLQVKR